MNFRRILFQLNDDDIELEVFGFRHEVKFCNRTTSVAVEKFNHISRKELAQGEPHGQNEKDHGRNARFGRCGKYEIHDAGVEKRSSHLPAKATARRPNNVTNCHNDYCLATAVACG